ncbi:response regulator [Bacillus sp. SD088]|uniref:response regulator n=1 Tax=Bacillus sp. SD088 TaxID=2782012 RepID=UPI001A96144A|nr:response regulator [Bacillus sp. SD088]MBO0993206.1 response regulator [Bacillus sp. SD088]
MLIVEDEIRLLNGITNNIPWKKISMEIIGAVSNGLEALKIAEEKKVDIILLDIRMPEIDGITLAKLVLEKDPSIKIIFLTGHDDFNYAQEAINMGVYKYLLKPAGDKEILESVKEAAVQKELEWERKHKQVVLNRKWNEHLPYLQELFLQRLILEGFEDREVKQKAKELMIDLPEDPKFIIAALDIDSLVDVERVRSEIRLQQYSIFYFSRDFLEGYSCELFRDSNHLTIILFSCDHDNEDDEFIKEIINKITELLLRIQDYLQVSVSVGMSQTVKLTKDLPSCYQQALKALQERVVYGRNAIIPFVQKMKQDYTQATTIMIDPHIETLIISGELIKATNQFNSFIDGYLHQITSFKEVKEFILFIYHFLTNIIYERGWLISEVLKDESFYLITAAEKFKSKQQIKDWANKIIIRIVKYAEYQRNINPNHLIKSTLSQIEKSIELEEEITLNSVAEKLFINPSYLSRLFKQETGSTFSKYLLERKMKRAKELLNRGERVYDTASFLGYNDVSYFTKVFRKYWGTTPGEIKKASAVK